MLFNSTHFVIFFIVTIILANLTRNRTQRIMLLVASIYFYWVSNAFFVLLLTISMLVDYYAALGIKRAGSQNKRKLFLVVSLIANLSMLGYFKYTNFLLGFINDLGILTFRFPDYNIALPVGISFYTFQSMSYTVDVYRKQIEARESLIDFSLYVAFFPQLVAGPIVRAQTFFRDLETRLPVLKKDIQISVARILMGFTRKLVFADNLAKVVDFTFANYAVLNPLEIWTGAIAFGFQIYFDFAGYTDIAIGVARLFGFQFDPNFNFPMTVKNIGEHWNKWHISFSTWIRDYIYIPLGGSRGGRFFIWKNLTITWLFGGIWHGAAYHYVFWGLWQAVMIIGFREYSRSRIAEFMNEKGGLVYDVSARILTMASLGFGFVMFRAETMTKAWDMMKAMVFVNRDLKDIHSYTNSSYGLLLSVCFAAGYYFSKNNIEVMVEKKKRLGWMILACFYLILVFGVTESKSFLYFAF